jgi:[ribosomal protein S5]-alanine N-acetyltransferase
VTDRSEWRDVPPSTPALPMQTLTTPQLTLEPQIAAHADAMFEVLSDPAIYPHLDDSPPVSVDRLRERYARLEARMSPDGSQRWLNWVIRPHGQSPVGFVQATIAPPGTASIAYVLSSVHWGRGYASIATRAMIEHLATAYGVHHFTATVEAENQRSIRLLEHLDFRPATAHELAGHRLSPSERLFVR